MTDTKANQHKALRHMDTLAKLMDGQFRIPGTEFRFGLDAIIGLIPGAGDFSGFLISAYMLTVLAKNGASGFVLARMVLNIVTDALIGSIPVAGDLFDFVFKANQRNMKLMHEHYEEGRHRGGAWKVIVPVLLVLGIFMVGVVWVVYKVVEWVISVF
jgi:hypothetical protein